jgi:hypothetical protein
MTSPAALWVSISGVERAAPLTSTAGDTPRQITAVTIGTEVDLPLPESGLAAAYDFVASSDACYVAFTGFYRYYLMTYFSRFVQRDTCTGVGECASATRIIVQESSGREEYYRTLASSADGQYVLYTAIPDTGICHGLWCSFVQDTCVAAFPGCVPGAVMVSLDAAGQILNSLPSKIGTNAASKARRSATLSTDGRLRRIRGDHRQHRHLR